MIIDSFDDKSKALIDPIEAISEKVKKAAQGFKPESFILTFSEKLFQELLNKGIIEAVDEELKLGSAAGKNPICRLKDSDIGVFLSGVGAPLACAAIEELHALFGCRNYIVFGSCGALIELAEGKLIVPTAAYRDEGVSYHYLKAADYVEVSNAKKLSTIFAELKADHVSGKTWTTDGFYRETISNRDKRIKEGCICVEMECAALQAVCAFRGLQLYQFLYSADSLQGEWLKRILGNLEMEWRLAYFYLAKAIAEKIRD